MMKTDDEDVNEAQTITKAEVAVGEESPAVELLREEKGRKVVAQKVSVSLQRDYPRFEAEMRALPKLRFDAEIGKLVLEPRDGNQDVDPLGQLAKAFGLDSKDAALLLSNLAVKAVVDARGPASKVPANAILGLIADAKPSDSIEAMLTSMIMALGIHASKALAGAVKPLPGEKQKGDPYAQSIKLIKAQSRLVDSLTRYQRKGRQSVTVEHLSVV